jgi:hypothetical protein
MTKDLSEEISRCAIAIAVPIEQLLLEHPLRQPIGVVPRGFVNKPFKHWQRGAPICTPRCGAGGMSL